MTALPEKVFQFVTADEQLQIGIVICDALFGAIRELGQVPSGTLYAVLMPLGINLATYDRFIGVLIDAGQITRRGDLLALA